MPGKLNLSWESMKAKMVKLKNSVLKKKHKSVETNLEQLGKVTDEAVDELEKEGKAKEAKKLKEEAAAVQEDPSGAGEFNKKVKRLELSKKIKDKLVRFSARIEVVFIDLKKDFVDHANKVKKRREEVKTKSKVLKYFKTINGIAGRSSQLPFFKPLVQGKGFQVDESNLAKLIPEKVKASKLNTSLSPSVRKWVNEMLKTTKKINKELEKEVKHCNGLSDKEEIIKYMAGKQALHMGELIKVLKLPIQNEYESRSLGKIANNPECKKLIENTVELLEGNINGAGNHYRRIVS